MSIWRRVLLAVLTVGLLRGVIHFYNPSISKGLLSASRSLVRIECQASTKRTVFLRTGEVWRPEGGYQFKSSPGEGAPSYRDLGLPKDEGVKRRYFVNRSLRLVIDLLLQAPFLNEVKMNIDALTRFGLHPPRAVLILHFEGETKKERIEFGGDSVTHDGAYFFLPSRKQGGVASRVLRNVIERLARKNFAPSSRD